MGSFYTSLHVKSMDKEQVRTAIESCHALPAYLSDCSGGWISIYPRATEWQDDETLKKMARELSGALHTGVFGFLVHDSDIFMYALSEDGKELDFYCSDPGYFDGKDLPPSGGHVDAVLKYCIAGTTADAVKHAILEKPNKVMSAAKVGVALLRKDVSGMIDSGFVWNGDSRCQAMADLLGIDGGRASAGYKYIRHDDSGISAENLEYIKDGSESDELPMFKVIAGLPRLIKKADRDMERLSPETRKVVEERRRFMILNGTLQETDEHTGVQGEEIRIFEQVCNGGGTASGIAVIVSGEAVEKGLVEPRLQVTVTYNGDGQNDFDPVDPADERFWPYEFSLVQSSPAVWTGSCKSFPLVPDFMLEIYLKGVDAGKGGLSLEVKALEAQVSSLNFSYEISVLPAESLSETEAHQVHFFGYTVMIPAGFESMQRGFGIACTRFGYPHTEFSCDVLNSSSISTNPLASFMSEVIKKQMVSSLEQKLKDMRVEMKSRLWQTEAREPVTLGGITFERAFWSAPSKGLQGMVMFGRDGDKQILLRCASENDKLLSELEALSLTFKVSELPAGETSAVIGVTGVRRKSKAELTEAIARAPFRLKLFIFALRMMFLGVAYKYVIALLPGVQVGNHMGAFALYFGLFVPLAIRVLLFVFFIGFYFVLRQRLLGLKAMAKNPAFRIAMGFVGYGFVCLALYWLGLIAPTVIRISSMAGFFYTASVVFAIGLIRLAMHEFYIKRAYPSERKS